MTRISRMIVWLSLAFLLNILWAKASQAQTINAASCNSADVQAPLNKVAADGTAVRPQQPQPLVRVEAGTHLYISVKL